MPFDPAAPVLAPLVAAGSRIPELFQSTLSVWEQGIPLPLSRASQPPFEAV